MHFPIVLAEFVDRKHARPCALTDVKRPFELLPAALYNPDVCSLFIRSDDAFAQGCAAAGLGLLQDAMQQVCSTDGACSEQCARVALVLVLRHEECQQPEQALAYAEQALMICKQHLPESRRQQAMLAEALCYRGVLLSKCGKRADGLEFLEEASAVAYRLGPVQRAMYGPPDKSPTAHVFACLRSAQIALGRVREPVPVTDTCVAALQALSAVRAALRLQGDAAMRASSPSWTRSSQTCHIAVTCGLACSGASLTWSM